MKIPDNPSLKDIVEVATQRAERLGYIKNGQVTEKGWALFQKQWRAWKASRPN